MNLQLRAATVADVDAVAAILIRARAAFMPYAPPVHPEADVRAWVRSDLLASGGVTVAEREGLVVGVMATTSNDAGSWINQMAVNPDQVGRGIGSALLTHALATLHSPVRLYAFQANVGARRFYERHGFVARELSNGDANEEHCPDVLYEYRAPSPRQSA